MAPKKAFDLCTGEATVSSELAKDPSMAPSKARTKLYGHDVADAPKQKMFSEPRKAATSEDLELARKSGDFGDTVPSELFLRIYHDAISCLTLDPLQGMVSPPLMGSTGTVPLTIISTIPDICRHMSNCIARAEHEVFFATNFWKYGEATKLISNSIRELSRRAGEKGERRVVKVMYDRGSPKQFIENHLELKEADWTAQAIQLPKQSEIPNIDLQVVNYHRPIFGTFHSKFVVIDRRIGIISSNNIQDNDNLEMMTHIEGPIVDSLYDAALLSWHEELKPPLPTHDSPAKGAGFPAFDVPTYRTMFSGTGTLKDLTGQTSTDAPPEQQKEAAEAAIQEATHRSAKIDLPEHTGDDPHYDDDIMSEVLRNQSLMKPRDGEGHMAAVTRKLNTVIQPDTKGDAPECGETERMTPMIPLPEHAPVPMAMVCRKPWGMADHTNVHVPQNEAFLSAIRNAERTIFIQTPNLNARPLTDALCEACKRGVVVTYYVCLGYNDSGELLPFQNGHNEMFANRLYSKLDPAARRNLVVHFYVAKDQTRPIHNRNKQRSCHIKLLIADEHIAIQGNGNQDTQSWFHSQEINFMLDSRVICAAWIDGLKRNQNTHLHGRAWRGLEDDEGVGGPKNSDGKPKDAGCWYDAEGKQAPLAIGVDPGRFSWARGFVGAVQRVRGVGGF